MRMRIQRDPLEDEQWNDMPERYEKVKSKLVRSMWEWMRRELHVDPRRVSKQRLTQMMGEATEQRKKEGGATAIGTKAKSFVVIDHFDSKGRAIYREKGMWARGLYGQVSVLSQSKSRSGRPYVRTYRPWKTDDNTIRILGSDSSLKQKSNMLGHSEEAVRTKIYRLKKGGML